MKRLFIIIIVVLTVLSACSDATETPGQVSNTAKAGTEHETIQPAPSSTPVETTQPDKEPVETPSFTPAAPTNTKAPKTSDPPKASSSADTAGQGVVRVRDGDTLERDIIPQLEKMFSLTEKQLKDALSGADSPFGKAPGFRRMEGVIVPGAYDLNGKSLDYWIKEWISGAELRYEHVAAAVSDKNGLSKADSMILASVVEGDTNLADSYESTAATVYLNRIKKNDRFGSCPTVEYALGYQRPYLLNDDVDVSSKYNTYKYKGLPPGPICCFDDESLKASIEKPADSKLYFFFYDYVKNEMLSFMSYSDFKAAAKESKALFEATFTISRFEKMADKREFF